MDVLITGGAGYIGSTIASALADAGHRPVLLDDLSTGRRDFLQRHTGYVGDVADRPLVRRILAENPGITAAVFTTPEGDISVTRFDGRTATLSWPGRVDRMVALHRRDTAELLAEELRRLDPDEVYAETLHHVGVSAPAELPQAGELPAGELPAGELPAGEGRDDREHS